MTRRRFALATFAVLGLIALSLWGLRTEDPPEAGGGGAPTRTRAEGAMARSVSPDTTAPVPPMATADPVDAEPDEDLAALAAQLAADPNTHVACDLSLPVARATGYLAIGGHSEFNGRKVEVVDGKAYLPLVYDLGDLADLEIDSREGLFSLEGYGPVAVRWSDRPADGGLGRCEAVIAPEPGRASLTGTVKLDPSGEPAVGAWVEGCGNLALADESGGYQMDIVTEPCAVMAMRQDGLLRTTSELVEITPSAGRDVVADFVIPEAPKAGLGVKVASSEDGIVIEGLVTGGPAKEAGLREGDLVVAIDGAPTGDDLGAFVEAVGGEAGTAVTLTVDRGGQELEVVVNRRVLEPG